MLRVALLECDFRYEDCSSSCQDLFLRREISHNLEETLLKLQFPTFVLRAERQSVIAQWRLTSPTLRLSQKWLTDWHIQLVNLSKQPWRHHEINTDFLTWTKISPLPCVPHAQSWFGTHQGTVSWQITTHLPWKQNCSNFLSSVWYCNCDDTHYPSIVLQTKCRLMFWFVFYVHLGKTCRPMHFRNISTSLETIVLK